MTNIEIKDKAITLIREALTQHSKDLSFPVNIVLTVILEYFDANTNKYTEYIAYYAIAKITEWPSCLDVSYLVWDHILNATPLRYDTDMRNRCLQLLKETSNSST